MRRIFPVLGLASAVALAALVLFPWCPSGQGILGCWMSGEGVETETVTWTEYSPPGSGSEAVAVAPIVDDRLEDKATTFDPGLVDRRPEGGWRVNLSEAVIRLDAPMVLPDVEPGLLALHPSYAAAIASNAGGVGRDAGTDEVLPSVNMIDGKAKQFDDGLVAALVRAMIRGEPRGLPDPKSVVERLLASVGPEAPASPFLAAGLTLLGEAPEVAPASRPEMDRRLGAFAANEVLSRPIGFYTWNKTLSDAYRFLRFFQQPFDPRAPAIPRALASALARDPKLLDDYRRVVAFQSGLTNPPDDPSLADLLGGPLPPSASTSGRPIAIFPPSGSREERLFARLFPRGLPPGADLMRALIARIRSGEVDLTPREGSGWYDHQVYALETLLLPEKGAESRKLLLTGSYKRRMLEAFKALMTKRRETHAANLKTTEAPTSMVPPARVAPRLRVEPCPSYYLRTARAYAFLAGFLESAAGPDVLGSLHGLREGGERPDDLKAELGSMRDLFYGLALLSSEDVGMRPALADDEPVDRDRCERLANDWLAHARDDPDLAADTRVSVPVFADPGRRVTRLWATLGVRLTRLTAGFARPPRIKPGEGEGDGDASETWRPVEPDRLGTSSYLIPVDEFAEVELRGNRVLTRAELRAACDAGKTREAIVSALGRR